MKYAMSKKEAIKIAENSVSESYKLSGDDYNYEIIRPFKLSMPQGATTTIRTDDPEGTRTQIVAEIALRQLEVDVDDIEFEVLRTYEILFSKKKGDKPSVNEIVNVIAQ